MDAGLPAPARNGPQERIQRGLLLGAFAGAGVWQTLENGLGIIGAPVGIQRIVIGVIVAGAVLVDVVFRQGTKKAKK